MPLNSILDVAKNAILNNLESIDITSRNISNVNTEGYKRRRIESANLLGLGSGNGYDAENAVRVYNQFVETELMRERQTYNKYSTINNVLSNTETIFGETEEETGLSYILQNFWAGWNDLANDPESHTARMVVYERGKMLTNALNRLHQDLLDKQEEISYEIDDKVNQINSLLKQLYELNQKITKIGANELLDQRDYLLSNLSEIVDIQIRYLDDNKIIISVGGQILLAENYLSQIKTEISYNNGFSDYSFYLDKGTSALQINGGTIAGLIEVNNQYIPEYVNYLDTIATTLVSRVNSIHAQGYNLEGQTGIAFFNNNVTGSGDISINPDIARDPALIAASATGNAGDGSIALAIAGIQTERLIKNDTIANYYTALVSQIGSQVQETSILTKNQENVVAKLENQRDAISGVSLEEELTNLIKYQQSYQAAARMLRTADEVVAMLMNYIS